MRGVRRLLLSRRSVALSAGPVGVPRAVLKRKPPRTARLAAGASWRPSRSCGCTRGRPPPRCSPATRRSGRPCVVRSTVFCRTKRRQFGAARPRTPPKTCHLAVAPPSPSSLPSTSPGGGRAAGDADARGIPPPGRKIACRARGGRATPAGLVPTPRGPGVRARDARARPRRSARITAWLSTTATAATCSTTRSRRRACASRAGRAVRPGHLPACRPAGDRPRHAVLGGGSGRPLRTLGLADRVGPDGNGRRHGHRRLLDAGRRRRRHRGARPRRGGHPPPGAFDLVHARLMLVHVADRAEALRRMAGALRPGGWLLLEDADPALQPLLCPDESGPDQRLANPAAGRFPHADGGPRRGPRLRPHLAGAARGRPGGRPGGRALRCLSRPAPSWRSATVQADPAPAGREGLPARRGDRGAPRQCRRRPPRPTAPMISAWGRRP